MSQSESPSAKTGDDCCGGGDCSPASASRRTFLGLTLTGLGLVAAPTGTAQALGLDPAGLVVVPREKNLTPDVIDALAERGAPTEYTGAALQRIGMPTGGGCSGLVYLAGDGQLWARDIFNPSSFPLGGASGDGPHYAHPLRAQQPFRQGFALRTNVDGRTRTRTLDAEGFPDVRFSGQYPLGTTTYRSPGDPVEVTSETFSPFIPLATDDSTLPVTVLAFTVRNTSNRAVSGEITGLTENPVCLRTRRQQPVQLRTGNYRGRRLHGVEFSAADDTRPDNDDRLFEDWESGTYRGWTVSGTAFGAGPVDVTDAPKPLLHNGDLTLSGARFVTSYDFRSGADESATGTLTSGEFTITRRYAAISVGGPAPSGRTGVHVLVDGKTVASATGQGGEPMVAQMLDLGAWTGRKARIEIVDDSATGHLNVDSIVFTNVPDIVFEDWESGTYRNWTVTGSAFGPGPVRPQDTPADFRRPIGDITDLNVSGNYFATSYNYRGSATPDVDQGTMTSKDFTITRRYVTVWAGGGGLPDTTCVNVLVGDAVVASYTGVTMEPLVATSYDVSEWAGKRARIEIVDAASGGWGHISVDRIVFSDRPVRRLPTESWSDLGTFCLAALDPAAVVRPAVAPQGAAAGFDAPATSPEMAGIDRRGMAATVAVPFTVPAGRTVTVRFVIAWYFPVPDRTMFTFLQDGSKLRHHYATRFASAAQVAQYVADNLDRLERRTRQWVSTWYTESTLPYWFLERTLASASTLATNTCYRFDNGRFYAWEGLYCCVGTCGHVWNYAQTIARLFPDLERDTRARVDLGIALRPTGEIGNRGEAGEGWFADGQCGTILRIYREHQMAPDNSFLRGLWPKIRSAVEWVVSADGNANGILEGSQWNTLDAQWFGEIPWISGLYVAALRAASEMADEVGDHASAQRYATLAERGSEYLTTTLWSEEYGYFFQQVDPDHPTAVNSNRGCYIDQMFGQSFAAQLGLPRVFPRDKATKALSKVFANNFLPDAAGYHPPGIPSPRVYAETGEAGTLMCTWPNGGSTETGSDGPVGYFNEVWTGQEYQFAAHLFAEGMTAEALAVSKAVHDRYAADKRNPYNEVECSDHYTRAMMSYGTYLAACGYEHHGPRGHLGFAPRMHPEEFAAAFTTAQGWGRYHQHRDHNRQTCTVELRYGTLTLRTFAVEVPGGCTGLSAALANTDLSGPRIETSPGITGTRVLVTFPRPVRLTEGSVLRLDFALRT